MTLKNGWIKLHRKVLESDIMAKPPLYFKLWVWMLFQARFNPSKKLKRGQFKTSIQEMREAMAYKIGYKKITPTIKQVRGVYTSLTLGTMIVHTKVTGGMLITICNYDKYQAKENSEGHNEGHSEGTLEGTPYIEEERKKKEKEKRLGIYKKSICIPNNYSIQPEHIKYASLKNISESDVKDQFEAFVLYFKSTGKLKKDWYATYQVWIRNAIKFKNITPQQKQKSIEELMS